MTIGELNGRDCGRFVDAVGWVFEGSPWVAERAWQKRPFVSLDALHEAMTGVVASADEHEQLALLRAHPALGAVAGDGPRSADGSLSDASRSEQAAAGLDALSPEDGDRLSALNAAYVQKFGFPFLYAVKGATPHDVLNALEKRLPSTREAEQQEALRQVCRIARFRLERAVGQQQ